MEWLKRITRGFLDTLPGQLIRNIFTHRGITGAMHFYARMIVLVVICFIIVFSLVVSIERRVFRKKPTKECWKRKSRILSALLAMFTGMVGTHRFYLGYIFTGVIQIVGLSMFLYGGWLLGNAGFISFILLKDEVIVGLTLFQAGLAVQMWHFIDFFMILFGGMVPKNERRRKRITNKNQDLQ